MRINSISTNNYSRQNFGAKIDYYTRDFIVDARKKGLQTKKMETLMKQVAPEGEIYSSVDRNGNLLSMTCFGGPVGSILKRKNGKPYPTTLRTVDIITNSLRHYKEIDKTATNEKPDFTQIVKRDHEAELKKTFGKPIPNLYDNDIVIEQDY